MSALELPTLSEKDKEAIEWMNETIENVHFFISHFLFSLTNKEKAMDILLEIYFFNNNRYPFKKE